MNESDALQKTIDGSGRAGGSRRNRSRRVRRLLRWFGGPVYQWYEKRLVAQVSEGLVPAHIGLILDGNRRFARGIGLDVCNGHDYGANKVQGLLQWCHQLGVANVTIFAFSTENFRREPREVAYLFDLFVREIRHMIDDQRIRTNKIRVKVIGQRHRLPASVLAAIDEIEASTVSHDGMLLNIALGYGGREEITDAVKSLLRDACREGRSAAEVAESLTTEALADHLYTAGTPDPDFIIRTSGEQRLSGFFLWQAAYSEYYFCDALWPAFRHIDFLRAVRNYQQRNRRFGC